MVDTLCIFIFLYFKFFYINYKKIYFITKLVIKKFYRIINKYIV